jgi:hypothetical protein
MFAEIDFFKLICEICAFLKILKKKCTSSGSLLIPILFIILPNRLRVDFLDATATVQYLPPLIFLHFRKNFEEYSVKIQGKLPVWEGLCAVVTVVAGVTVVV